MCSTLSFIKKQRLAVTDLACKLDRLSEASPDFTRIVSIRVDEKRDLCGKSHLKELASRIHLSDILP